MNKYHCLFADDAVLVGIRQATGIDRLQSISKGSLDKNVLIKRTAKSPNK